MAIYGLGSNWEGEEVCHKFFKDENYTLGWSESDAEDIYVFLASLKAGDIIYLKANQPGNRKIRVKGIGFVKESFISNFRGDFSTIRDYQSFSIPVAWVSQKEFFVEIPPDTGRLTNIRAAAVYEEYLPFVQKKIINELLNKINKSGTLDE